MPGLRSDPDGVGERMTKPFGRERSIHAVLGGGKVADVLLWRNQWVSGATMVSVMAIWFLFEYAEYNFVTFLCHLTITSMLLAFIWSTGAKTFRWTPPDIPKILLEESRLYEQVAITIHRKSNFLLSKLLYIACGYNLKLFFSAILTLSILSMVGSYISTLNLLFIGILCMGTLPFLYENYEEEIDYFVHSINRRISMTFKMFEVNILSKIPRRPLKD